MTNTHIDKEAREAIRMLLDHIDGTSTLTEVGKVYIRETIKLPLPAEGESSPKPEAGEQMCSYCAGDIDDTECTCQEMPAPTPQPAEPKVMPPEEYGKGSIDWSKAAIVPPVSPQPSEQAKGEECDCGNIESGHRPQCPAIRPSPKPKPEGEWLPEGMVRPCDTANPVLANARDQIWRMEIESERAQHKAEMEAVKKGASR